MPVTAVEMDQSGLTEQIDLLRQAIAAQESLREALGDTAVDNAIAGLKRQLARFDNAQRQQVSDEEIHRREHPNKRLKPRLIERHRAIVMGIHFSVIPDAMLGFDGEDAVLKSFVNAMLPLLHASGGHVETHAESDTETKLVVCFASHGLTQGHVAEALSTALQLMDKAAHFALDSDHHFDVRIGLRDGLMMGVEDPRDKPDDPDEASILYSAHPNSKADAETLTLRAGPGGILVDDVVQRLSLAEHSFETLGRLQFLDSSAPVPIWELVHRGRGHRGLSRLIAAPLVGRPVEWERLLAASRLLSSGHGSVSWIQGEAGIGKTRLIEEVRDELMEEGWLWLEVSCHESDRLRPHRVVRDILRSWLGRTTALNEERTWRALSELISTLGFQKEMPIWQPAVATLGGVNVPQKLRELMDPLDGQMLRNLGRYGLATMLERAAADHPVVLVADDLHLADESSLMLLQHLVASADQGALWLILSTEDGSSPELARLRRRAQAVTHYEVLDPQPLNREDALLMVHALLGLSKLPPRLEGVVLDSDEGLPLVLEMACLSLLESGAVVRDPTAQPSTLTPLASQFTLPGPLAEMVNYRIASLDPIERELVELLSAHCGDLDVPSQRVLNDTVRDSREALRSLRRRRLVKVDETGRISLAHELIRQHLYADIEIRRRRALHLTWARSLKLVPEGAPPNDPALLAWQFARAGDWRQAHSYLQRSAELARRQGGAVEFLATVEMLRETAARVDQNTVAPTQKTKQDRHIGEALKWLHRPDRALAAFSAALDGLGAPIPEQEDDSPLARTSQRLRLTGQRFLTGLWKRGDKQKTPRHEVDELTRSLIGTLWALEKTQPRRYLAALQRLQIHGERQNDSRALLKVGLLRAQRAGQGRRGREAGEHLKRARRAAEVLNEPLKSATVDLESAWHASCLGNRETAQLYSDRGAEVAWAAGDLKLFARLRTLTGRILYHQGDLEGASRAFMDVEEVARRGGDAVGLALSWVGLALVSRRMDGPEAATSSLTRAVRFAGQDHLAIGTVALAEAWLNQVRLGHDQDPTPVLKRLNALRARSYGRLAADHAAMAMCEGMLIAGERSDQTGRKLAMKAAGQLITQLDVDSVPQPLRGTALRLEGMLYLRRGDRESARLSLGAAVEAAGEAEALLVQADAMIELARLDGHQAVLYAAQHIYERAGARACVKESQLNPILQTPS